ncbi:hypothetical protein [Paenibacillus ihuae]|uniref:hypothetical protein n=1 Tax=Paenibacillus ihuae TaxID=1232431 RepID=UPI000A8434A9|nr:hypothetical protein [Paenibacillus ihuae]
MNNLIMILSIIFIGIFTVVLNQKVKNKSRMSMILAIIFVLYIATFIIIGMFKN